MLKSGKENYFEVYMRYWYEKWVLRLAHENDPKLELWLLLSINQPSWFLGQVPSTYFPIRCRTTVPRQREVFSCPFCRLADPEKLRDLTSPRSCHSQICSPDSPHSICFLIESLMDIFNARLKRASLLLLTTQGTPWLIKENQYLDSTRVEVSSPTGHKGAALLLNRPHRQSRGKAETWIPSAPPRPLLIGQEGP